MVMSLATKIGKLPQQYSNIAYYITVQRAIRVSAFFFKNNLIQFTLHTGF